MPLGMGLANGNQERLGVNPINPFFYSNVIVAPKSSNNFLSFSASSLGTFSLITLGADSTNFFAYFKYLITSTKFAPGRICLISLITLAFLAGSNLLNVTLNWV